MPTTFVGAKSKFGCIKQTDYGTEGDLTSASVGRFAPYKSSMITEPEIIADEGLVGDVFQPPGDYGFIKNGGAIGPVDCRYEDYFFELLLAQFFGALANPDLQTDGYEQVYTIGSTKWFQTIAHYNPGLVGSVCTNGVHVFTGQIPTEITIRGDGAGRVTVETTLAGKERIIASATNTSLPDLQSTLKPKLFQKDVVFRINKNSAGALASGDTYYLTTWTLTLKRSFKDDIAATGSAFRQEPEPNGFWEATFEATIKLQDDDTWDDIFQDNDKVKFDLIITGPSIGTDDYSFKLEVPRAELTTHTNNPDGPEQVMPEISLKVLTSNSPTGMAFTSPVKLTVTNTRATNITA